MSNQKTCEDSISATSSRALEAGRLLSSSPEYRTISRCGRVVLRASLSAWLAEVQGQTMNVTWLLPFSTSSESVILQSYLASRLEQQLRKTAGSTLYCLSWKHKATPAQRTYSQLLATAHTTKGKESFSVPWPTPIAFDSGSSRPPRLKTNSGQRDVTLTDSYRYGLEATPYLIGSTAPHWDLAAWSTPRLGGSNESVENWLRRKATEYEKYPGKGIGTPDLSLQAQLAYWTTPSHSDGRRGGTITPNMTGSSLAQQVKFASWPTAGCSDSRFPCPSHAAGWYREDGTKRQKRLQDVAGLAVWPTASATDGKGGYLGGRMRNGKLSLDRLDVAAQLATQDSPVRITWDGMMLTGYCAGMDVSGQLNPEHSRWLMGYPGAWGYSKDMVTPSFLKSQLGSSVSLSSQLLRLAEAIYRNRIAREK